MKALLAAAGAVGVLNLAGLAAQAQPVCDVHHLGYTEAECNRCTNMTWSVSRVFPRGVCTATTASGWGAPTTTCTLTHWGGATLLLRSPNFSATGVPLSVCKNGYDLGKSQLKCSTGSPAQAFSYPNTNVTCNGTVAVGANPQVTITGSPCCIQ